MESTQNETLFSEISAEESAAVNGGYRHCGGDYDRRYVSYYRNYDGYNGGYSRRHYSHRSRSSIGFGIVVRYNH